MEHDTGTTTTIRRKPRKTDDALAAIRKVTLTDGSRVAHVPLADGRSATVDAGDLDRLLALGLSPTWVLNDAGNGHCYVRTRFPTALGNTNNIQVSRAILEPLPGHVVRHLDGNRLNLRHCNLVAERRATRAKARERFFEARCAV